MDNIQRTPFVRELASSDRKVRDKALESLTLFLKSRRDLELVELLKIWKGLFFCFYHSDRPLTQQSLARALSYTLLPSLPEPILQPFLRAFWITMSRDFHSLDRLRLDKYLYLIRCYVGAAFEILLKKGLATTEKRGKNRKESQQEVGNEGSFNEKEQPTTNGASKKRKREDEDDGEEDSTWKDLETYISMLEEGPLCPYNFNPDEPKTKSEKKMPKGPDGIRYHLMDIWLDELEKFATDPEENKEEKQQSRENGDAKTSSKTKLKLGIPMEILLRPFHRLREKSPNKTVRKRALEVLEDQRLIDWGVIEPKKPDGDDQDDEWGGFD
ncbi:hypothetical protein VTO42DRAFT_9002 [Malbranchea cinnamomea]